MYVGGEVRVEVNSGIVQRIRSCDHRCCCKVGIHRRVIDDLYVEVDVELQHEVVLSNGSLVDVFSLTSVRIENPGKVPYGAMCPYRRTVWVLSGPPESDEGLAAVSYTRPRCRQPDVGEQEVLSERQARARRHTIQVRPTYKCDDAVENPTWPKGVLQSVEVVVGIPLHSEPVF